MKQRTLFALLIGFAFFTTFVYTSGTDEEAALVQITDLGREGRLLYQKYNCTACHQFYGMGGYLGPDITNVISAAGKGEPYVRALLQVGTDIMPDYDLSEREINALVAFLEYVDATGRFPEPHAERTWYGSIKLPSDS